jgi:hypothetical protein
MLINPRKTLKHLRKKTNNKKGGGMKQKQVERILEDRIDIPGIAKELLAAGFIVSAKKKGAISGAGFLGLLRNPERFQKLKDGWIKDTLLGLDWGPSSSGRMNWKDAQKYCADQGGRLPEIDELASLADRSKYKPAIDPIFTDTQSNFYWSGATCAVDTDGAWYVDFYYGDVSFGSKTVEDVVRPVRSSQ